MARELVASTHLVIDVDPADKVIRFGEYEAIWPQVIFADAA